MPPCAKILFPQTLLSPPLAQSICHSCSERTSASTDGAVAAQENLRQLCVFRLASDAGKPWMWWDYVTRFGEECTMAGKTYNEACAEKVGPTPHSRDLRAWGVQRWPCTERVVAAAATCSLASPFCTWYRTREMVCTDAAELVTDGDDIGVCITCTESRTRMSLPAVVAL